MSSVGESMGILMEDGDGNAGSLGNAAKKCRYCGAWSTSPCPWDLRGTCLAAWHPDIPWGRGKQGAAVGSICKPCQVVWDQGGFDAEGATEDQFARSIAENPSKLHEFLAVRAKMIKKKIANPYMRFRLEINGCTKEKVTTGQHSETGLEAPETFFVELDAYEKKYGKADPEKISFEEVEPGVVKAGVNVRTGVQGWHKRINKNYRSVNRTAQLNDEYIIDPTRDSLGLMHQAAKKTVLKSGKDLKIAKEVGSMERMLCLGNGSMVDVSVTADPTVPTGTSSGSNGPGTTPAIESDGDDDEEHAPVGMMEMLKGFSSHVAKEKPVKAKTKAKPLAAPSTNTPSIKRRTPEPADATPAPSVSTPSAEPKAKAQRVDQVGIGRLGNHNGKGKGKGRGNKRQKTQDKDDSSLCMDIDPNQEPFDFTSATSLCDADRATMEHYDAKFKALKDLSQCPLPDSAFKTFLLEKQTIISSLAAELKNKKKSAGRRALKESDPLFIAIGDVQEVMISLQNLLKCLLGTAQIDAETSLLAYIDDAMRSYELKVNSSIMRRALKSLINDDFKLGAWSNLVSVSKKTIDERFLPADDGVTADDFYMLMCSQILQKMLRTATQKFKPKEKASSQTNKTAMEGTEAFLLAIQNATSSPKAMVIDSSHVINILKAETSRLDELAVSLDLLEKLKKTPDQKLPLSQSFAVSNIGGRIMTDANEQHELRKETSGPLEENIQSIVDTKLNLENIDAMTKSLGSVHEPWQSLKEKKLPKDTLAAKLLTITSASCKIVAAGWVLSAAPWLDEAIQSMANGIFTPPDASSWPMAQHLSHFDFYKPNRQLIDLFAELSKCTVAMKGGQDVLQNMQKHLSDFKNVCHQLQGGIVQKLPANESELTESFAAIMAKMATLTEMIDKQKSNQILDMANVHLATLCNDMLALMDNKSDTNLDEMKKHCAQLSMHAASLQMSNPRRESMIQSAELCKAIFLTVHGLPGEATTAMTTSTVRSIYECLRVLNEFNMEKVMDTANIMTLGHKVVDPTELISFVTNLMSMATAQLNDWWLHKETQLNELMSIAVAMDVPDASSFSFPEDDDSCLTSSSMPMLQKVAADPETESTTSGLDTTLKAMQAMKVYNLEFMESKNDMVTRAVAIHHSRLSILAIACLVRTFTCKRFSRAVSAKTQPPKDLVAGLATTMKTAREVGLTIPPGLQARVGKYVESKDAKDTKSK